MERPACDVPLAKGAQGLAGGTADYVPQIHGEDGFGNANFPDPAYTTLVGTAAAQLTVDLARQHPGELTYIGLGPLTNLAIALLLDPDLPTRLTRIVWMGGAVRGGRAPRRRRPSSWRPARRSTCRSTSRSWAATRAPCTRR
ncbi:nucleoside hydrolase [Nonomuraea endophytica]|uniref:Inosine-uridine nucleoside N-ribohydrolase n=1 Tax=Nonomuraea endophytica TaxID=714136 RepID=A0A7W8AEE6_9ACTN|nr:nucleoside hydrolase [Nonomuraea endophytica]MBB5083660.1 inosine-uridine nucleoside N-ribohydrolase [Nonomuraea endophytica]